MISSQQQVVDESIHELLSGARHAGREIVVATIIASDSQIGNTLPLFLKPLLLLTGGISMPVGNGILGPFF